MSTPPSWFWRGDNRLLSLLPPKSRERLGPMMTPFVFELGHIVLSQGAPIASVYFPLTAVFSLVVRMEDGRSVEAAPVGFEGIVGVTTVLGERISEYDVTIQGAGKALRVATSDILRMAREDENVQNILLRYAQIQMIQASRAAACNRLHDLEERLARWLLHMHDWIGDDRLRLTQDFLSIMLGVRRASVTVSAGILQNAGLISYQRGEITVLDRAGLEDVACEDYPAIREAFDRLLPART